MQVSVQGARPKAYSYLRFSTPDQITGDSFSRQWRAATAYAEVNNLDLDEDLTFHDLGVPGFRGANAERGKLRAFRRAVEDGRVAPGSYLLVEDFDRLSRMDPWDAFPIFQEIINSDISIVTLKDGKVWNKQTIRGNALRLMEPLFAMWTGHSESAKNPSGSLRFTQRSGSAFRGRKAGEALQARTCMAALGQVPQALRHHARAGNGGRDVFAKADAGWSLDRIAEWLNRNRVATWDNGKRKGAFWRRARLRRMLTNRAAIGGLVMHKTDFDPDTRKRTDNVVGIVEECYPAIVDRELFERVNARLSTKASRGRNAARPANSIVAGLAQCVHCGGSMIKVSKGQYVYVVCSRAHAKAGCKYQAVPYSEVEKALRLNAASLVEEAPRGQATSELEEQLEHLDLQLSDMKDDAKELLRELRASQSPTVREALHEAESDIKATETKLRDLRDRRERLGMPFVVRRLNALSGELKRQDFNVAAANHALKAAVERIVLDPERARLDVHWRDSDVVSEVPIWSRHATIFDDRKAQKDGEQKEQLEG